MSTSVDYVAALGAAGKLVPIVDRLKSGAFLLAVTGGSLIFATLKDVWLVPLVVGGVGAAGLVTVLIDRAPAARRRFYWLCLSLFTNFGILAFFKYFNFFVSSAASVLAVVGLHPNIPLLQIILPVGISFYTFQTMTYALDIYRGKLAPTKNFADVAREIFVRRET